MEHLQKKLFFPQVDDIKILDTFNKIQNLLGTTWSSIIITYNFSAPGPKKIFLIDEGSLNLRESGSLQGSLLA